MSKASRKPDIRWIVVRDYYADNGDKLTDEYCILFGTQAEATECLMRLSDPDRADRSYFDPDSDDAGFLHVDEICI